jgi:hypothetical protein
MLDRAAQVSDGTTTAGRHRDNKLVEDAFKLVGSLNRHIAATGCLHCKQVHKNLLEQFQNV